MELRIWKELQFEAKFRMFYFEYGTINNEIISHLQIFSWHFSYFCHIDSFTFICLRTKFAADETTNVSLIYL